MKLSIPLEGVLSESGILLHCFRASPFHGIVVHTLARYGACQGSPASSSVTSCTVTCFQVNWGSLGYGSNNWQGMRPLHHFLIIIGHWPYNNLSHLGAYYGTWWTWTGAWFSNNQSSCGQWYLIGYCNQMSLTFRPLVVRWLRGRGWSKLLLLLAGGQFVLNSYT